MNHFYQDIQGWFSFENFYAEMAKNIKDDDHYVEVGAWKGKSASYMATEIYNSGKAVTFDVIDTWKGSAEFTHFVDPYVQTGTLYDHFLGNMKPVEGFYNPKRMNSLDAVHDYDDNTLDWVLIDASHDYDGVKADIIAWLPKVKSGGILAGDDYGEWWPGVPKAVDELLPNKRVDGMTWIYHKP